MTGLHPLRVLVPMLGRGHLAGPLVENLRLTSAAPVTFLCSPGDDETIAACEQTGEDVMVVGWQPGRADYARKINAGFAACAEDWVFTGASDIVFHPRWEQQALQVGDRIGAGVVGTQDTRNPLVRKGLQSTHSLVRRAYVHEFGSATFDKTGAVYSEVYDHQYIDLELVETAKLRNRWAFAKRAVVEHRHPAWKSAPEDDTYVKAWREAKQDHRLYQQRMNRCRTIHARNKRRRRATL
jgi:hypothetical protein